MVGGRGGQAEAAQEAQLMEYAPAWGARRPEWTCPHLEKGPTSPGAAPPRPPAGHNGWSRQPHEVSKPTPWPAVGQAGPAGNSGARGPSVRSPAAGHPRLPLLALRPLVRPSPCPSVLGSGRCQGRGMGGGRGGLQAWGQVRGAERTRHGLLPRPLGVHAHTDQGASGGRSAPRPPHSSPSRASVSFSSSTCCLCCWILA